MQTLFEAYVASVRRFAVSLHDYCANSRPLKRFRATEPMSARVILDPLPPELAHNYLTYLAIHEVCALRRVSHSFRRRTEHSLTTLPWNVVCPWGAFTIMFNVNEECLERSMDWMKGICDAGVRVRSIVLRDDAGHWRNDLGDLARLAIRRGYLDVVRLIFERTRLKEKGMQDRVFRHGDTPLHFAARAGHAHVAAFLLTLHCTGLNTHSLPALDATPLHLACQYGHADVVKLLLDQRGIEPNASTPLLGAPLHVACEAQSADIVGMLLSHPDTDPNIRYRGPIPGLRGETPLLTAVCHGRSQNVVPLLMCPRVDTAVRLRSGDGALLLAASQRHPNMELMRYLVLSGKFNVNDARPHDGLSVLHVAVAASTSNADVVKFLLSCPEINANPVALVGDEQLTPLLYASMRGRAKSVEVLLANSRVDIRAQSSSGCSALMLACIHKQCDVAKLLLSCKSVGVNEGDGTGATPLYRAVKSGCVEIVGHLLGHDAIDVNKANVYGGTPLHEASHNTNTAILELLLSQKNISVNAVSISGATPLLVACSKDCTEAARLLLADDATDVNMANEPGVSPLWAAVYKGNIELVEALMGRCDLDVNWTHVQGMTPLMVAVYKNHADIVRLLLGSLSTQLNVAVDLTARDSAGWTALHMAAANGNCDIVALLVPNIGDVNARASSHDSTPLHFASQNGHIDVVRLLLKHSSIDVNACRSREANGDTPLHLASFNGHDNVVAALLAYEPPSGAGSISAFATDLKRANVSAVNIHGDTPLHEACRNNRIDVARTLLKSENVKVDSRNTFGESPRDLAHNKGHSAIVELLDATL